MTLKEYQEFAARGVLEATLEREPVVGFALGLAGEAGEVVDDIKKRIFHGRDIPLKHTEEELGDVLWYVANIATQYGFTLDNIIEKNVQKLSERYYDMYHAESLGGGVYNNRDVRFERRGPHIAMYYIDTSKFIKFLSKEEKKYYGLDTQKDTGASETHTNDAGCGYGQAPWE